MERANYNYVLKNIPIPIKNTYLKNMITKVEAIVRSMRWKAYFHNFAEITSNFGFKSTKSPPPNQLLVTFENDLYELTLTIKFKLIQNQFQT